MIISDGYLVLAAIGLVCGTALSTVLLFVYVLGVPWSVFQFKSRNRRSSRSQYSPVHSSESPQLYQEGQTQYGNKDNFEPSAPPIDLLRSDEDIYFNSPMVCVASESPSVLSQDHNDTSLQYNDLWASVLFLLNICVITYFALKAVAGTPREIFTDIPAIPWVTITIVVAALFIVAMTVGGLWLSIVIKYSRTIIQTMLWMNIIFQFVCAVGFLFTGNIIIALLFSACAMGSYCYMSAVQRRLDFASAVLAAACSGLKHHLTQIAVVSFSVALLQVVWLVVWTVGACGVLLSLDSVREYLDTMDEHDSTSTAGGDDDDDDVSFPVPTYIIFMLLLSLYWGLQVLSYITHTTVGGGLALWWFHPDHKSAISSALLRACTFHFGSICFGALLVAIVHTLRELVRFMRDKSRSRRHEPGRRRGERNDDEGAECLRQILLCLAEMLLSCLESVMRYINKYALCFVAAYGDDFVSGGKAALHMFAESGMTALVNDNLISNVFSVGVIVIALLFGLVGALLAYLLPLSITNSVGLDAVLLGILGGYLGVAVGVTISSVIDSAVAMLYVCFTNSPEFLKRFNREEYDHLFFSWREFHPESLQQIAPAEVVYFDQSVPSSLSYQQQQQGYYREGGSGNYKLPVAEPIGV